MEETNSVASIEESTSQETEEERSSMFCLVCRTATVGPEGSLFIKPCRCGYWVHDSCLINMFMLFEDNNPGTGTIGCRICKRAYNISPVQSFTMKTVSKLTGVWYQAICSLGMETILILVTDAVFIRMGSLLFRKIYGPEEAVHLFLSMTPLKAVLTCQLMPVASIIINLIPWEYSCLQLLRKCSRLPLVGGVFPLENPDIPDVYKAPHPHLFQNLSGGLLLPFCATVTSCLFTGFVENPLYRLLLGGATFILFKGLCQMYCIQKKYVRQCTLRILDSDSSAVDVTQ